MNHIHRLTQERDEAQNQLKLVAYELTQLRAYLESAKFQGPDNDYVHVSTDIAPKLARLSAITLGA